METMRFFIPLTALLMLSASCQGDRTVKVDVTHSQRNAIVNVKDKVVPVEMDSSIIIGPGVSLAAGLGKLFISEAMPAGKIIQVLDATTMRHIGSFGQYGPGPGEVLVPGKTQVNTTDSLLYIFDYGHLSILAFNVDSALTVDGYKPWVRQTFDMQSFPDRYRWVSDSVGFGRAITPNEDKRGYTQVLCRYNMNTGGQTPFGKFEERGLTDRSLFDVDADCGLVAEVYNTNDLIVLYDLDGNVLHRIYGPAWVSGGQSPRLSNFTLAAITDSRIYCAYSGNDYENGSYSGTLIHVIDHDGNYVNTLDLGRNISNMLLLPGTETLFFNFDDDLQFGLLDLSEIYE